MDPCHEPLPPPMALLGLIGAEEAVSEACVFTGLRERSSGELFVAGHQLAAFLRRAFALLRLSSCM